jgi:FdrA protein
VLVTSTAEALKALKRGLHVFIFSDNVPVTDEALLKRLAATKKLLVMGPDCGTAIADKSPQC